MEGHGRRIYLEKNSRLFAQIMGESSPPRSLKHTWWQKEYATNWQFRKTKSRMGWQNIWIEPLSKLLGWCLSMRICHTDFGLKPCPLLLSCETEALPKQSVGWLHMKRGLEKNHELTDSESLGVKPLYTYPTMRQLLEDLHNGQIEPTVICKTTSLLSALLGPPSITRGPNILILSIIMFERRSWTPLSSYDIVQWVTW